jgi:Ribonuclease G/E
MNDPVNHPKHYTEHPSGVECIQITEHMSFNLGNAVKYIWRADLKGKQVEDLKKAIWYINREIERINNGSQQSSKTGISEQSDSGSHGLGQN